MSELNFNKTQVEDALKKTLKGELDFFPDESRPFTKLMQDWLALAAKLHAAEEREAAMRKALDETTAALLLPQPTQLLPEGRVEKLEKVAEAARHVCRDGFHYDYENGKRIPSSATELEAALSNLAGEG